MKKIISAFLAVLTVFLLCSCEKKDEEVPKTVTEYETTQIPSTEIPVLSTTIVTVTEVTQKPKETRPPEKIETTTKKETPTQTEQATYEKTGDMAFSDKGDNRYIKAVSSKYGVDASLLVALYTVPENDSNVVLRFDGTKGADGKLIRNKSTLVAIYTIDKALNSKCASENRKLNEYSYGEMKVIYFSTTKYIMPEFENQL